MRVLCVSSHLGSISNVRPEAEWFIGLQRCGIEMTVMTEAESVYAGRMRAAGVRVVDLHIAARFSLHAIRRIRHELREHGHQVLHLFNNRAITNGIIAASGLPAKVVTYRGQTGNISRRDPTCYLTHLHPKVARITCVADAVRVDLIRNGVRPDKLVTIYKGHDPAWYADVRPDDRQALGLPDGAFAVACVANNRPRKGVPVLIEAAQYLPPETRLHFLLVGNGMTGAAIRAQVETSPLRDRFHLVGYREDVLNLVAACDATVLPATKREGLPKTVLESMALGIVPVVTRTGGSPELVEHGVSGLVCEPGDAADLADALQSLADEPGVAARMGAAARERLVDRFNVRQGVDAHVRLYRELAGAD